jgi:TfoX/Sxy family transcriptional regulator of competence genes
VDPFNKHLYDLLEEAAGPLPAVSHKRMFGCDALFAEGNIFGLIWKEGRIGVRLPDAAAYDELLAIPNAKPWSIDKLAKPMSHWVLVPESFHDDMPSLARWVTRAHAMAAAAGPRPKKKGK